MHWFHVSLHHRLPCPRIGDRVENCPTALSRPWLLGLHWPRQHPHQTAHRHRAPLLTSPSGSVNANPRPFSLPTLPFISPSLMCWLLNSLSLLSLSSLFISLPFRPSTSNLSQVIIVLKSPTMTTTAIARRALSFSRTRYDDGRRRSVKENH